MHLQDGDRQLKEQFLYGLNNSWMLAEIIREITKSDENVMIPEEGVLVWANRIEDQTAQVAIINSCREVKNLDIIQQKVKGKEIETKLPTLVKTPMRRRYKCCHMRHKPR